MKTYLFQRVINVTFCAIMIMILGMFVPTIISIIIANFSTYTFMECLRMPGYTVSSVIGVIISTIYLTYEVEQYDKIS